MFIDEIVSNVGALRGRDGVREFSYQALKGGGFQSVLEPVIHLSLSILGATPRSIFSRGQAISSLALRGFEMNWTQDGPASGTVRLRCEEPVPEITWVAWEGVFLWGCELASKRGTVGAARPATDGRSCEYAVSWD